MQNDPSDANKATRDQIMAAWRDSIPPTLWNIYCGFIQTGFTPEQAIDLTKFTWLQISKDVRGGKSQFPEEL